MSKAPCPFPGCGKPVRNNGLCVGHNRQRKAKRILTPLRFKRPKNTPPVIRTVEAECPVASLEGPCLLYVGGKPRGYGILSDGERTVPVHRYAYEKEHGPISPNLVVDHQCRVRACCNPKHLRVVTRKVNAIENSISFAAVNHAKTHCPAGHPYDESNTKRSKEGYRSCKRCVRIRRSKGAK